MRKIRLNIGCGTSKIKGYINIDSEKSCKPDLIWDITRRKLPYRVESVDEIIFFHCIEHIQKSKHRRILSEFNRVLKIGCKLYISYPNFWECALRWKENTGGQRKFWEATLYGRQLYDSDYHVCAMSPDELTLLLYECGYDSIENRAEPDQPFNTVTIALKAGPAIVTYENLLKADIQRMQVKKNG